MWVDCSLQEYVNCAPSERRCLEIDGQLQRWSEPADFDIGPFVYVNEPVAAFDTSCLLAFHKKLCADAHGLMRLKNADYAQDNKPFKNFELCEVLGLTNTDTGMLVRLADKIQRLAHMINGQEMKVKDESLRDTLLDIVNYTILIGAYVESKKDVV